MIYARSSRVEHGGSASAPGDGVSVPDDAASPVIDEVPVPDIWVAATGDVVPDPGGEYQPLAMMFTILPVESQSHVATFQVSVVESQQTSDDLSDPGDDVLVHGDTAQPADDDVFSCRRSPSFAYNTPWVVPRGRSISPAVSSPGLLLLSFTTDWA